MPFCCCCDLDLDPMTSGAVLQENIWGQCPLPPKIEAPNARIEVPKALQCRVGRVWGGGVPENFLLFNLEVVYIGARLRYSDVLIYRPSRFQQRVLAAAAKIFGGGKAEVWRGAVAPAPT